MDELQKLYDFIDLAEKNRKYPPNTAQGRRAALKLFDTVLNLNERQSISLIEERMKEIYLNLISKHRESFSIQSLNTYKGRFLKLLQDYKRYGNEPDALVHWHIKERKYTVRNIKDDSKDTSLHNISFPVHRGVHKFQVSLESGEICTIESPSGISPKDAELIKGIIDALYQDK